MNVCILLSPSLSPSRLWMDDCTHRDADADAGAGADAVTVTETETGTETETQSLGDR